MYDLFQRVLQPLVILRFTLDLIENDIALMHRIVKLTSFVQRDSSQPLIAGQICAGYEKGKN